MALRGARGASLETRCKSSEALGFGGARAPREPQATQRDTAGRPAASAGDTGGARGPFGSRTVSAGVDAARQALSGAREELGARLGFVAQRQTPPTPAQLVKALYLLSQGWCRAKEAAVERSGSISKWEVPRQRSLVRP